MASEQRLPRFHVPDELSPGGKIRLPDRVARHIAVLRLRQDQEITLFNGRSGQYQAVLSNLERGQVSVRILQFQDIERESPLNITLAQCLSAGDRMDMTLQKATELGVAAIVPLASKRSIVRLSAERAARRLEHWRNVVIAACEQCGRNRIPEVRPVAELLPWLSQPPTGMCMLLDPEAGLGVSSLPAIAPEALTLLIGPEGGLTPDERAFAGRGGFMPIRLGPRTLRTETAPLATLATLQTVWGDFR
jgi:16S rRNA (uracil1498-N3)-methyltransferase